MPSCTSKDLLELLNNEIAGKRAKGERDTRTIPLLLQLVIQNCDPPSASQFVEARSIGLMYDAAIETHKKFERWYKKTEENERKKGEEGVSTKDAHNIPQPNNEQDDGKANEEQKEITIYVQCRGRSTVPLNIDANATVGDLRVLIQNQLQLSRPLEPKYNVSFRGPKLIGDDALLADFGISNGATVEATNPDWELVSQVWGRDMEDIDEVKRALVQLCRSFAPVALSSSTLRQSPQIGAGFGPGMVAAAIAACFIEDVMPGQGEVMGGWEPMPEAKLMEILLNNIKTIPAHAWGDDPSIDDKVAHLLSRIIVVGLRGLAINQRWPGQIIPDCLVEDVQRKVQQLVMTIVQAHRLQAQGALNGSVFGRKSITCAIDAVEQSMGNVLSASAKNALILLGNNEDEANVPRPEPRM